MAFFSTSLAVIGRRSFIGSIKTYKWLVFFEWLWNFRTLSLHTFQNFTLPINPVIGLKLTANTYRLTTLT